MFEAQLNSLKSASRYRSLNLPAGIDLTSNDYLGMARHPLLRAAAIEALQDGLDIGAAGSRLLRGHTQTSQDLEQFATEHFNSGGALFFSSGFQANFALLTTLPARGDVIIYDALVHASMRDGLLATNAKSYKFAHNDLVALESVLKRQRDFANRIWIAVESLYSMDGDIAPLKQIYALAEKYDAQIIIDEAHGTGVYGEGGRGLAWDLIKAHGYKRITTLHTCGKAIGVAGGLICAAQDVIEYIINAARPFIYTTAPMPLQPLLVQRALQIISSADGDERRAKLHAQCAKAKTLFGGYGTQVVPIMIGDDDKAVAMAKALQGAGYDIRAIRPPTVPEGSARLRLSLSSELDDNVLDDFASKLREYHDA